jgi:hypothetical protein
VVAQNSALGMQMSRPTLGWTHYYQLICDDYLEGLPRTWSSVFSFCFFYYGVIGSLVEVLSASSDLIFFQKKKSVLFRNF